MEYRIISGGVSNLSFHLVWFPKNRVPVLVDNVAEVLDELLREKAEVLGVEFKHLTVQSDHVHLFVRAPPEYSPAKLAREFKGYTSRILRERHKHLATWMPTLWSRSYYVGSVGHVSDAIISRYIATQETRKR